MIFSLSRMESAEKSAKDSAQSPAWSRKARPSATSANWDVKRRASPAKTSGGRVESWASAFLSASASGHSGCCAAGNRRHDAALHEEVLGSLAIAQG